MVFNVSDPSRINCRLGLTPSQPFYADLGALYGPSLLHIAHASVHRTVVNAFKVQSTI